MKFDAAKWKETFLAIHAKTPNMQPCNGAKTAIASMVYVRNMLIEEVSGEDAKAEVKLAFAELIGELADAKLGGFACNASAAAAMAGIKVAGAKAAGIDVDAL